MYPEIPHDALIKMDRDMRANALNSRYIDILRARMFLTTGGFDATFPEDIGLFLGQVRQLADAAIKKDYADKKSIISPLMDDHKGRPYSRSVRYQPGTILVWGVNNLLFFEVVSNLDRGYLCKRGEIVVNNRNEYSPVFVDKPNVRVGKDIFAGIVFPSMEVLKENVTSPEHSSERYRLGKMLEIIDRKLSDVWSKHLPYK